MVVNPTGLSTAPVATITGITAPSNVAFGPLGDLFVMQDTLPYSIRVYAPPYTGAPSATITSGVNDPRSMTVASTGDLFVGNFGNDTVTRYTAPYTAAPASTTSAGVHGPQSLVVDPNGTLHVANFAASSITEYTPPFGSPPVRTVTQGIAGPLAIAYLTAENLVWVANSANGTMSAYGLGTTTVAQTIAVGGIRTGSHPSAVPSRFRTPRPTTCRSSPYPNKLPAAFDYTYNVSAPSPVVGDSFQSFYVADAGATYVQQFARPYNTLGIAYFTNVTHPQAVAAWP